MKAIRPLGNVRWQVGLVALLLVASLAALLLNALSTLALPQRELQARSDLSQVSAAMAQAATTIANQRSDQPTDRLDEELRLFAVGAMQNLIGVEGGFYLAEQDVFSGCAFPTEDRPLA